MLFFGRRATIVLFAFLLLGAAACNASPQPQPPFGNHDAGNQEDAGSYSDGGATGDAGRDADVPDGGVDGGDDGGGDDGSVNP